MKPLVINHKIYGRFKITEPVLLELIKSPALQRLKGVGQNGAHDFHYTSPGPFSRFQHSVGVMLLLRKFKAQLAEQIAGLLHDVSHTAFSHVADFVFNSNYLKHDYQDKKLAQAFEIQGINKILKKYKINPAQILNQKNFPLLEKELPDLCADRIDYTLQEPTTKKIINYDPAKFLKNLAVKDKKWVFINQSSARQFGLLYLKLNQKLWCCPLEVTIYQILAEAIKLGLDKKIISKPLLFTTDKLVMNKLRDSKDQKILERIDLLKRVKVKTTSKKQADMHLRSKPRIVDPYFLKNGKLIRLSTVDKNYKRKINTWVKQAKKGFYIKILAAPKP